MASTYANSKSPITVLTASGEKWVTTFSRIKNGCRHKSDRLAKREEEVKDLLLDKGYKLLSKYKSATTKIKILSIDTGETYNVRWNDLQQGHDPKNFTKKNTLEEIKTKALVFKYKIISKQYVNAHGLLNWECPHGHKFSKSWNQFNSGLRCPHCSKRKAKVVTLIKKIPAHEGAAFKSYIAQLHLKNLNKIIVKLKEEKYKLLNPEEYQNNLSRIKLICPRGHMYETSWRVFQWGCRCKECNSLSKRHPYAVVKAKIESEGYKLLSETYNGSKTKLSLICPKEHLWETTWGSWKNGGRCFECFGSKKTELNTIKEAGLKEKYTLLSTAYNGNKDKLRWLCPNNHIWPCSWGDFRHGYRCQTCSGNKKKTIKELAAKAKSKGYQYFGRKGNMISLRCSNGHDFKQLLPTLQRDGTGCYQCSSAFPKSYQEIVNEIANKGFKCITAESDYQNINSLILVECEKGHQLRHTVRNLLVYGHCKFCGGSGMERELTVYLESLSIDFDRNNRSVIDSELDFYLPKFKLGIEMNGLYWHSEKFKHKDYHLNKLLACQNKNIQLIQIFEDEWVNRKEQVLNFIESKLGINKKVFARKCQFSQIEPHVAKQFLEKYHIEGLDQVNCYLGLFYDDELVQVMSFDKSSHLLSRFCTKRGKVVIGGISKLLKRGMILMNTNSVSTFVDLRYSDGKMHRLLGFEEVLRLGPDHSYIDNIKRINGRSLKKVDKAKHIRIYDCGRVKYKYAAVAQIIERLTSS